MKDFEKIYQGKIKRSLVKLLWIELYCSLRGSANCIWIKFDVCFMIIVWIRTFGWHKNREKIYI